MPDRFLPGVPGQQIEEILNKAPGNEISSGKLDSPESSAALAVNTFGFFLNRPTDLPLLPGLDKHLWSPRKLEVEKTVRFPWRGGKHPHPDVVITTDDSLIGIESKRYEPFRNTKSAKFSDAFWRPRWGDRMGGYQGIRDQIRHSPKSFIYLDATQLVKHALALRTQVNRPQEHYGLAPVLLYIYAEPLVWPRDGSPVDQCAISNHRKEVFSFAKIVAKDEVRFIACSYTELLSAWGNSENPQVRTHAKAVTQRFAP